jgi:hypothetical protein
LIRPLVKCLGTSFKEKDRDRLSLFLLSEIITALIAFEVFPKRSRRAAGIAGESKNSAFSAALREINILSDVG